MAVLWSRTTAMEGLGQECFADNTTQSLLDASCMAYVLRLAPANLPAWAHAVVRGGTLTTEVQVT